jgi:hypothetical protein
MAYTAYGAFILPSSGIGGLPSTLVRELKLSTFIRRMSNDRSMNSPYRVAHHYYDQCATSGEVYDELGRA